MRLFSDERSGGENNRKVWNDAFDIATLRKGILEFRARLQAVVTESG